MEKGDGVEQGVVVATQGVVVATQPVQGMVVTQPVPQGVVVGQPVQQQGAAQIIPPPGRWLTPWINTQPPTCIMALCCQCVYIAQLHERVVKRNSFQMVLGVLIAVKVGGEIVKRAMVGPIAAEYFALEGVPRQSTTAPFTTLVDLAVAAVYLKYVITIRKQMRARDNIQDESGKCGTECCTSFWCQACVLCQMYTHDNKLKGLGQPQCDCSPMGLNGNYPLVQGEHVV